ncbi:MAG: alpha/beta hydrolase [Acidobacteriota bacterium]
MKITSRLITLTISVFIFALIATGQDMPVRTTSVQTEYECIRLMSSNRTLPPGPPEPFVTYHHVWSPNLHTYRFASGGLNLAYNVEGKGKELAIVVAGGPGLPREYFQPALAPLGQYMTLVYYDRRADVLSTKTNQFVSVSELADDVNELRKTLGYRRVTLIAHSFGGAIALNYALRYPENVKRLILVNTSAFVEDQREVEKRLTQSLNTEEMATLNRNDLPGRTTVSCDTVRNRYRVFFPHYFRKPLEEYLAESNLYAAYFDALARKLSFVTPEGKFDVRSRLGEIKVPTLVIAGKYDLVTPIRHADELAQGIPNSRLAVFKHSGHFAFIEENFLFTEWVRQFVTSTVDLQEDLDIRIEIATPGNEKPADKTSTTDGAKDPNNR